MTSTDSPVLDALRWRYATKHFDPSRKISDADWETLEQSLVLTPSSFGLQPWTFIVVNDVGVRANLADESWQQPQVTEASHYVVLAAKKDLEPADIDEWMERMASVQGTTVEAVASLKGVIQGFAQAMSHEARHAWNIRQVYIALGQLMVTAAQMGIDTCPMEGLSTAGYDRLLKLEGLGFSTAVACALGHRSVDDRFASIPKARFDRDRVIRHV